MKKNICVVIVLILLAIIVSNVLADSNWSWSYTKPTPTPTWKSNKVTWKCVDATSYDGNAYNDNKCTSSTGQVRYVSDSEARRLDPSYRPGQSGAWYYNNK